MAPIRAVTFDLWDTVFIDDSDEPRRKAMGLLPKREQRRKLVVDFLSRHQPVIPGVVRTAYDTVDAAFNRVWHQQNVTWTVKDRLQTLLDGLNRSLPDEEFRELVRLHEEMELEIRPDLAPGVREALDALRAKYRLAVVSDAIFSPGRVLRGILQAEGLFECFDAFAFSDEVGRSKPDASMFEAAANLLGVPPGEMVHIGDRESNDVDGPHRIGARAVLVTMVKDRRSGSSRADAVCEDYRELAVILDRLNQL